MDVALVPPSTVNPVSQRRQLFLRVIPGIHLRVRLRDLPLLVDNVGDAAGVLVFRRVARAVRETDLAVGVADQREGKIKLRGEALVVLACVEADADDLGVLLLVFFGQVPEPGTFGRSARCVGLRIEPEDDFLSAEIAEADGTAVMIDGLEIGGGIARLQHARTSSQRLPRVAQCARDRHTDILLCVEASELVIRGASLVSPGRALDLACGGGRNALYLVSIGWKVVAIDINPHIPAPLPAGLDVRTLNLEKSPLEFDDASFDLIVMTHYYQPSLFPVVGRLLRSGGVLVTSAKMTGRFAAAPDALRTAFSDWELIHVFENGVLSELIARRS